jgi:hypothetical protein
LQRKQWRMLAYVCADRVDGRGKARHEHLRGHPARNLAGAMPAHAVGERQNAARGIGRDAVLVVLTHVAGIGQQRHF